MQDFRDAMERSEVIEDYLHDKYGPSCLILGFTLLQRPYSFDRIGYGLAHYPLVCGGVPSRSSTNSWWGFLH